MFLIVRSARSERPPQTGAGIAHETLVACEVVGQFELASDVEVAVEEAAEVVEEAAEEVAEEAAEVAEEATEEAAE